MRRDAKAQLALDFRRRCTVPGCVKAESDHGRLGRYHWNGKWHWTGDDMGTDPAND